MGNYTLTTGNVLDYLTRPPGDLYHAVLTDAPYHLTDRNGSSKGFMNTEWDGGDIAFRPELWEAIAKHCHPGALILSFSSPRTAHRMATAMENGGLFIAGSLYWLYGSGFPKGANIGKSIDKRAGADREVVGTKDIGRPMQLSGNPQRYGNDNSITLPATDLARTWQHHRYNMQALKPAVEPIIIAQVPYKGTALDNIITTGAGAYNLSERVGTAGEYGVTERDSGKKAQYGTLGGYESRGAVEYPPGRIPANLVLSHNPDCTPESCTPGCAITALDDQSGESASRPQISTGWKPSSHPGWKSPAHEHYTPNLYAHDDSGGASRYFHQSFYTLEKLEEQGFIYAGKVTSQERDAGLENFDPRTTTDGRETPIDNAYQRGKTERKNYHPTLKPIQLTEHLARLLLPPVEYTPRRIFIPFSGSGSEMIGAVRAGWDQVDGVELLADHVALAEARLKYWTLGYTEQSGIETKEGKGGQLSFL